MIDVNGCELGASPQMNHGNLKSTDAKIISGYRSPLMNSTRKLPFMKKE